MKSIFTLLCSTVLLFNFNLKAQSTLEKAILQLNNIQNVSYTSTRITKDFFSDDLSKDTLYSKLSNKMIDNKRSELFEFITKDHKEVFNGNSLLRLDENEKTYVIRDDVKRSLYLDKSLFGWLKYFQDFNVNTPHKVKSLPDTLLNNIPCYHIKMIIADTVIKKEHQYSIYDIYLNKSNFLPVRTKNRGRGVLSKGGYEVAGIITYMQEQNYTNYKIDDKNFPDLSEFKIPVIYQPEKNESKPMLADGIDAPDWALENTIGKSLSSKDLKGKIVVIDFTANSCVACILAVPTMNNLHKKYTNTNVEIISINSWDKKEAILKFAKQHKMTYPIFVDSTKLNERYNVSSIPSFYIIDKDGKIAASYSGFSDKLQDQLISKIEELNK